MDRKSNSCGRAIALAEKKFARHGGPFGAVIVARCEIMAKGTPA